jgi:NADH-quinone oxidoreductase subunit J
MSLNILMLIMLAISALWAVMARSLLRSAIGLAVASVVLTMIMFNFGSPLAAVFELSVCSGLISVLFLSTISLTQPLTMNEVLQHMKERLARFWYLPFIALGIGIVLSFIHIKWNLILPMPEVEVDVREVLWSIRQLDLFGQVIILLAGVFAVVILFKEKK